jgi:hypothetical protein
MSICFEAERLICIEWLVNIVYVTSWTYLLVYRKPLTESTNPPIDCTLIISIIQGVFSYETARRMANGTVSAQRPIMQSSLAETGFKNTPYKKQIRCDIWRSEWRDVTEWYKFRDDSEESTVFLTFRVTYEYIFEKNFTEFSWTIRNVRKSVCLLGIKFHTRIENLLIREIYITFSAYSKESWVKTPCYLETSSDCKFLSEYVTK